MKFSGYQTYNTSVQSILFGSLHLVPNKNERNHIKLKKKMKLSERALISIGCFY